MGKLFDKSWNKKTELERFQSLVDWIHEMLWGKPRTSETECKATVCCEGDCHIDIKPKKRKRARKKDGTFRGDDKSTPDVNEAWENE
tara:strand:- start:375 stop:635 length:261 start_codon:yes stop_codon:yes gene_type:complete